MFFAVLPTFHSPSRANFSHKKNLGLGFDNGFRTRINYHKMPLEIVANRTKRTINLILANLPNRKVLQRMRDILSGNFNPRNKNAAAVVPPDLHNHNLEASLKVRLRVDLNLEIWNLDDPLHDSDFNTLPMWCRSFAYQCQRILFISIILGISHFGFRQSPFLLMGADVCPIDAFGQRDFLIIINAGPFLSRCRYISVFGSSDGSENMYMFLVIYITKIPIDWSLLPSFPPGILLEFRQFVSYVNPRWQLNFVRIKVKR